MLRRCPVNELKGKVAIITGGASGIGLSAVELFLEEGARVVCADIQDEVGHGLADRFDRSSFRYIHADVSRENDIESMVNLAVAEFGQLDVLFNNAGIEGENAATADATVENWDRVLSIDLKGVFLGMKYAIPAMLDSGGGTIVNTASVAGLVGFAGITAYCAAKGGVIQLTKAAALEYATSGIRVNAICPGVIDTPMVRRFVRDNAQARAGMTAIEPVGRMGTAREVAELALFLASERSSFLTGAIVPVDGGLVAR